MKVQMIATSQTDKKEIAQPKYYCSTCTKCSLDNNCDVFQRHIEPNYNKCFYHSNYQPLVVIFRPLKNLDAMIEEEQKRKRLTYA